METEPTAQQRGVRGRDRSRLAAGRGRCALTRAAPAVLVGLGVLASGAALAHPWGALPSEWKVRTGDGVDWGAPDLDDSGWRPVGILSSWAEQGLSDVEGIVWYRTHLTLSGEEVAWARAGDLGVLLGSTRYGGFQVYAGGELVGESPGWSVPLAVKTEDVYPVPLQGVGPDGALVLALRVRRLGWMSNRAVAGAPVTEPVLIGERTSLLDRAELILARERLAELHLLLLAAGFALVGLYHLLLFARRPDRRAYLWFGALGLLFALNTLANSVWPFGWTVRLDWTLRLAASSGHLLAAAAIQFLWSLFGRPIRWPLRAYQLSQVAMGAWALLWPVTEHVVATGAVRWMWLVPLLAIVAWRIGVEVRRGDREARILVLGALVAVALEAVEVTNGVLGTSPLGISLAPVGFGVFLLTMAMTLADRFARLHQEVVELRGDLERKVRDRTRDLERARQRAEEADRSKARFLANIGHELRTPLTGILGTVDLLRAGELAKGDRRAIEQVRTCAIALRDLIEDLFDVARGGSTEIGLERRPFDPRKPLFETLELMAAAIRDSGLDVSADVAPDVPKTLVGDRSRIRRVLSELVSNALKFTERGTVRMSLAAGALPDGGCELRYSVADTGPGIPAARLDDLFVPFGQLDDSLARKHGGTGLGLALAKGLVEAWGGRITVESEEGRGTTVRFTVPGPVAEDGSARSADVATRASSGGELRSGAPREVLVVEDVEITLTLLETFLRRLGHRVSTARTGPEALAILEERRFDAVLLDIQLPGMDGFETSREIRRRIPGADRPLVVALTAHAGPEVAAASEAAGIDRVLYKPMDFEVLGEVVSGAPRGATGPVKGESGEAGDALAGDTCQVLDPIRMAQLREVEERTGEEVLGPLLRALVSRSAEVLPRVLSCSDARDWQELARLAHGLGGAAGNIGAARLARLCGEIEDSARDGEKDRIVSLLSGLDEELALLRVSIQELVEQ